MDYQVWTKDPYGDTWTRVDCGDLGAAKRTILAASKEGKTSVLTVEVPFELQLKVGEPGAESKTPKKRETKKVEEKTEEGSTSEADKDKAEQD